jgi:hypothetical protein
MTGDTVMGIAANKNEALRHFEQAHANTATGKNTYDRYALTSALHVDGIFPVHLQLRFVCTFV